jgi:AcrR family transcriptional regulator
VAGDGRGRDAGRGTRSRAGNAMGRTREAALDGAVRAVAKYGSRKTTMGDIAVLAGIAKATLYNHFRARDDVYRDALRSQVEQLATAARAKAGDGFDAALVEVVGLLREHPALRRLAREEPAVVATLAAMDDGETWTAVRGHVAAVLRSAGLPDGAQPVELVVRYLASQLLKPSPADAAAADARLLQVAVAAAAAPVPRQPADSAGTST